MIKQIFGRLPKKPSKSADNRELGGSLSSSYVASGDKLGDLNGTSLQGMCPSVDSGFGQGSGLSQVGETRPNGSSYEALPAFRDVTISEKQSLFIQKLNLCCVVFDFNDHNKNLKEKDIKRQTLIELVDYVTSPNQKFTEIMMQVVIEMVIINLFRSFTPQTRENKVLKALELEEDDQLFDPAWPHLQIVYELLLRFVTSPETDTKLAKRFIDCSFVLRLLNLFDSVDPREREYLKAILHRIYGRFMVHRPFIRKTINNIFLEFIFETEKFNGIAELLEVLGSVINGFTLPLKEEHKLFLVCILIPLHKPKCLMMYQQQLSYCVTQFVEKDCKLADNVIRGLLKYWPITNSSKEVMYLNELEEILEATQPAEFQRCMVPLFHQIARCLSSSHFQELGYAFLGHMMPIDNRSLESHAENKVAERTLYLWNNDHIENLITQNRKVILPIIFPALEKNGRNHWNQVVRGLTLNVCKIFSDVDPQVFEECLHKFEEDEAKVEEVKEKHEATWKHLEEIAASNAVSAVAVLVHCMIPTSTSSS